MSLRRVVGAFVVVILFFHQTKITVAGKSCKDICNDKWDVKLLYENCLRQCSQSVSSDNEATVRKTRYYPKPPSDIRVNLSVRISRYNKYIDAKVLWNAEKDEKREGFYLSFISKSAICEKKFPGFHTLNIASNATSFDIPSQTPSFQPLLLDFGCSYQLEMRSKPYPYGDPAFTSILLVDVPTCIEGFCTCRSQQKPPDPANVNIIPIEEKYDNKTKINVSWTFMFPNGQFEQEAIEFRVKLAELLRKANVAPWKKIFRWTQWEGIVLADKNREYYSVNLPVLEEGNEYKVQVFAFNQHMCRSQEVEQEFIATTAYKSTSSFENPTLSTQETVKYVDNATETRESTVNVTATIETLKTFTSTIDTTTLLSVVITAPLPKDEYLMVFLPIIGVLCLIISAFAVWKFCSSRKEKLLKKKQYLTQMHENPWTLIASGPSSLETNILYTEKEITEARAHGLADEFEISYERLSLGRVIGQGAFGLVYMGQAESIRGISGPTQIAIKQLKANADDRERKEFLSEIDMMKKIRPHPNIVTMYGCCTLIYPHCMVMEYVPYGDLLKYLRNLRIQFEHKIEEYRISLKRDYIMQLCTHPLMTRAEINANGSSLFMQQDMSAYDIMTASSNSRLSCQCGHCDNICDTIPFVDSDLTINTPNSDCASSLSLDVEELQSFALQVACGMAHLESLQITHRDLASRNILVGHGKSLKISDFGLSRVGIYVKTTSGKIPLRWLSIEAMRDHAYSTKSDVWAYGVVLWEICTLGGFPYPTMADKEILKYLESGSRLDKPGTCSDNIYKLMMQCWSCSPSQRPSFGTIKEILKDMDNDGHAYVEFSPEDDMELPPQDYCRIVPLATLEDVGPIF